MQLMTSENSKENLNLNTGTNTKRYKKKMKLDSNIIIKKILIQV